MIDACFAAPYASKPCTLCLRVGGQEEPILLIWKPQGFLEALQTVLWSALATSCSELQVTAQPYPLGNLGTYSAWEGA